MNVEEGKCKHCKVEWASSPRGLCNRCYTKQGIRELYPLVADRKNNKGHGVDDQIGGRNRPGKKLGQPTHYLPGTREKVEVLRRRARLGQILWHPLDAMYESTNGKLIGA